MLERYPQIDASLRTASVSPNELALRADDAVLAVRQFAESGVSGIDWEGWLVYPEGGRGHSRDHQGTNDYFDPDECEATIQDAAARYATSPEDPDAELYFCLTPDLRPTAERP